MATARRTSWFADLYQTFRQSIYSPPFYAALVKQTTGVALGYYLKFALVLTLIVAVGSASLWLGVIRFERNLPDLVDQLSNNFPAELTVTIQGGHASTNVTEPYFVPKDAIKSQDSDLKHWVVIDTKTPYSSDQFKKYQSYAWLTKDTLFYYGSYSEQRDAAGDRTSSSLGEVRAMPLSNFQDMKIDRNKVHGWIAMLEPWVRGLTPVFALLVLVVLYLAVLAKLVYLFFLAVLVWLTAKLMKKNFGYGAAYRVGLYAASLGFLLSVLAQAVKLHVPTFSVTVLSLIIVVVNLSKSAKPGELGFIRLGARRSRRRKA